MKVTIPTPADIARVVERILEDGIEPEQALLALPYDWQHDPDIRRAARALETAAKLLRRTTGGD